MITRSIAPVLSLILLGCNAAAPPSATTETAAASSLDGAWIVSEITTTGPDADSVNIPTPQPGYLLFTGRHYGLVRINTAVPRPDLQPADSATVEGLLAVYGNPFTAQAGTYVMSDSTITFTPLVAKNPAVMATGSRTNSRVRLVGDSLWLTGIPADTVTVPNPNPLTYKYVRAR